MKYIAVALMLLLGASSISSAVDVSTGDAPTPMQSMERFDADPGTNLLIQNDAKPMQQGCCKICTKGKACGNSCINRDYQCHQPPGCACDG
jgi:hypothetical protein